MNYFSEMKIRRIGTFIIKELMANAIYLLGGVIVLKFLSRKAPHYLVLTYHNFSKYNNYSFNRGSILETGFNENFEKQIVFLKKHFTFLYPEEFFEAEPDRGLNVVISFDDGYKDNYDIAFPILKNYQVKTIFFVVTSVIGTNEWLLHDKLRLLVSNNQILEITVERALKEMNNGMALPNEIMVLSKKNIANADSKVMMLNWAELREIKHFSFKVMPHTANHDVLSLLNKHEQRNEIKESINKIDFELNQKSTYMAYPNGLFDSRTIDVLRSSGIKYGFTTISGTNTENSKKLELKRVGINASDSVPVLHLKLLLAVLK